MLTRIRLKLGSDTTARVLDSSEVKNWDSLKYTLKRKDFGAVVRSFSTEFEFVGDAYDDILDEYLSNGMNAGGTLYVDIMNDRWGWELLFSADLDFSSISWNETTLSINCMDGSIANALNNYKSTKYEFKVADVKDHTQLYYDRVFRHHYFNSAIPSSSYTEITGYGQMVLCACKENSSDDAPFQKLVFLPMSATSSTIKSAEAEVIAQTLNAVDCKDVDAYGIGTIGYDDMQCIMKAKSTGKYRITLDVDANVYGIPGIAPGASSTQYHKRSSARLFLLKITNGEASYNIESIDYRELTGNYYARYTFDVDVTLYENERIAVAVGVPNWYVEKKYRGKGTDGQYKMDFRQYLDGAHTQIGFDVRVELAFDNETLFYDPFKCDVVKPEKLLSSIVSRIAGNGITCSIRKDKGSVLDNTFIVAAESVRGVDGAMLYTSFNDFCKWIESVFGYVYHIDESKKIVEFVHRSDMFRNDVTQNLDYIANGASVTINSSLLYSSVRVGYEQQDYEEEYGRDEWRWISEYTCDCKYSSNALELISPYRCDCYGMEYMAGERRKKGEESTDDNSDNDVFFVCASLDTSDNCYKFVRSGYTVQCADGAELSHADSLYNVMYSQYYMLKNNIGYISDITGDLKFASCEGNSNIEYTDSAASHDVTDNFSKGSGYITCNEVSVDTDCVEQPSDWSGMISFTQCGITYKGFISEVEYAVGRNSKTTYKLIVKSITKQ